MEGSPVDQGGHQNAQILLTRNHMITETTETTKIEKQTAWNKVKSVFGFSRSLPKTTAQVLADDKLQDDLRDLRWAFSSSVESILEEADPMLTAGLLKKTISEFTEAALQLIPQENTLEQALSIDMYRSLKEMTNTLDKVSTAEILPDDLVVIQRSSQTIGSRQDPIKISEEIMTEAETVSPDTELTRKLEEQAKLVRSLEAKLEVQEAEKQETELKRSVEGLAGFGKSQEQIVELMRQLDVSGRAQFIELLRSAQAQTSKTSLTKELGSSSAEDSTEDTLASVEIQRRAEKLLSENPSLNIAFARNKIREENPQLRIKEENEVN